MDGKWEQSSGQMMSTHCTRPCYCDEGIRGRVGETAVRAITAQNLCGDQQHSRNIWVCKCLSLCRWIGISSTKNTAVCYPRGKEEERKLIYTKSATCLNTGDKMFSTSAACVCIHARVCVCIFNTCRDVEIDMQGCSLALFQ